MKKLAVVLVALAVTAALAAPAFAEMSFSGYYRLQGVASNFWGTATTQAETSFAKDAPTYSFIDQRLRLQFANALNENVKLVWFAEVDTPWGSGAGTKYPGGQGGGAGADGVNVETKNVYLDVKLNDQLAAKVGVQTIVDKFEGMVIFDDAAAANLAMNFGAVKSNIIYSKFTEGVSGSSDDKDFYAAQVTGLGPVFAGIYYTADNSVAGGSVASVDTLSIGVGADVKVNDNLGFDGWVLYQDHASDTAASEGSAYAATARAKVKGIGTFRLLYFSEDDDAADRNVFDKAQGRFEFIADGLQIFLTDVYVNNGVFGRAALTDAAYAGYGLMGLTYTNKFTFGDYYLRASAGYFEAMDDAVNGGGATKQGTSLGFEVDAQVGRKLAEKVDVSLRAAYASLGDFYDTGSSATDPDDPWTCIFMLNVPY